MDLIRMNFRKNKMRIGFNTLFLIPGKVGGTETYGRGIISGLRKTQQKE